MPFEENVQTKRPDLQTIELTLVERFRWAGYISIGNPEQGPFHVQFNTGNKHLWITSLDYKGASGDTRRYNKYNHARSSGEKTGKPVYYLIDPSSKVTLIGPRYTDRVKIGNLEMNVPFVSATTRPTWKVDGSVLLKRERLLSNSFSSDYGLCPGKIHAPHGKDDDQRPFMIFEPHFVALAGEHHCITFAFYLSQVQPKFFFCGFDSNLAPHGVEYHFMINDYDAWTIGNGRVFVNGENKLNGKDLGEELHTVFVSGMSTVAGPHDVVKAIYDSIGGKPIDHSFYSFPCSKSIELSFSWDSRRKWNISPKE